MDRGTDRNGPKEVIVLEPAGSEARGRRHLFTLKRRNFHTHGPLSHRDRLIGTAVHDTTLKSGAWQARLDEGKPLGAPTTTLSADDRSELILSIRSNLEMKPFACDVDASRGAAVVPSLPSRQGRPPRQGPHAALTPDAPGFSVHSV